MLFDSALPDEAGLNLHCIFNISDLPSNITQQLHGFCDHLSDFRQLILLGHGGNTLWKALRKHNGVALSSSNPIDQFSIDKVNEWFSQCYPSNTLKIIYPDNTVRTNSTDNNKNTDRAGNTMSTSQQTINRPIGLQTLGELAGWHYSSPFMVGINDSWGSWFAYRAVILTDTDFPVTKPTISHSPCSDCSHKVCINSCPANACSVDGLDMDKCISYRRSENSLCRNTCLARVSCPIADQHRYSEDQINYHYTTSMKTIEEYFP